jgi:hypothetical protein
LQVFHIDIVKIDRDVAHVAIVVHVRCKRPFQMFYLFFQTYVASVLIWMLHLFHTYIASFIQMFLYIFAIAFSSVFLQVFQNTCLSVSSVFVSLL